MAPRVKTAVSVQNRIAPMPGDHNHGSGHGITINMSAATAAMMSKIQMGGRSFRLIPASRSPQPTVDSPSPGSVRSHNAAGLVEGPDRPRDEKATRAPPHAAPREAETSRIRRRGGLRMKRAATGTTIVKMKKSSIGGFRNSLVTRTRRSAAPAKAHTAAITARAPIELESTRRLRSCWSSSPSCCMGS